MTPLEPIMEGTFSGGSQAPRTAGEFMGRRNMKQELRKKNNFFIKSPDNITVGNYQGEKSVKRKLEKGLFKEF